MRTGKRPAPARKRRVRRRTSEALGHEAPGTVLRGPPLTITCTCGRKAKLRYGDTWTCEGCKRTWNTGRIPHEEYDRIRRVQLRFRLLPITLGLVVVSAAAFFIVSGNARGVFVLLPIALLSWFGFLRAPHRRRYRKAIASRQKWTLHEEP
jgi:hypothetical protein